MKKIITILLSILFILTIYDNVYAMPSPPSVSADSVVLMDAETGAILYSKNMDGAYPPASTTKTMTALLTLEKCSLNDKVKIGKNPPYVDGSRIGLVEGETISVNDLLHGLLIESGNDCAVALAEYIAGSCDKFAEMMNKKATELGCTDTNFVNPHGLYNPNHKTSAKDLALIMRELVKFSDFRTISTTPIYKIGATDKCKDRYVNNYNKLLLKGSKYYYPYAEGAKTGYTSESEHSYVASASKNGERLIVALVHSKTANYYGEVIDLFNYGFNNYTLQKLFSSGDKVGVLHDGNNEIPLVSSQNCYFVRQNGKSDSPVISIKYTKSAKDSFTKGDVIGEATITYNGEPSQKIRLLSGKDHIIKNTILINNTRIPNIVFYLSGAGAVCVLSLLIYKYYKFKNSKNNETV